MTHNNDYPFLSGPVPGLFDTSQPSRLLRSPTCTLFFAAFDPLTARAENLPDLSGLRIDPSNSSKRVHLEATASAHGKRIVVETDPESCTCSWRFVPRAKFEGEKLSDEGSWPRVVDLCGRPVRMSQDQWDIHKLDPEYDCLIRAPPNLTTIRRRLATQSDPATTPPSTPKTTPASLDTTPRAKRSISPSLNDDTHIPRKRSKQASAMSVDSDRMMVDEDVLYTPPPPKVPPRGPKKRRRTLDGPGEASTSHTEKARAKSTEPSIFTNISSNAQPRTNAQTRDTSRDGDVPPIPIKRVRVRSPEAIRREMDYKRAERERKRMADLEARFKRRQGEMHKAFWKDAGVTSTIFNMELRPSETGHSASEADNDSDNSTTSSSESEEDEEEARVTQIEESRRKLAELEKDRPLWEAAERKRREQEAEEQRLRERARAMKEEQERLEELAKAKRRQRKEAWEQELRQREREWQKREQSVHMRISAPRGIFRWNSRHALERYAQTASNFDVAKFSSGSKPLTFASVPWPVLHISFSVQDIDWDAVETFFREVRRLLMPAEYKELVEKSHRRFHPDRWRSRGLLVSVKTETERDLLEVAGSTVAQAITPLWKDVTGR